MALCSKRDLTVVDFNKNALYDDQKDLWTINDTIATVEKLRERYS